MARWSRKAAWYESAAERRDVQQALHQQEVFVLSEVLTPWQAAQICGVSDSFLAELRRGEEGPAFWWMGPAIYYMPADLHRWIASCQVVPYQNRPRAVHVHGGANDRH